MLNVNDNPELELLHYARFDESGCLVWHAAKFVAGYGKIKRGGRTLYAHRYAWELRNGPLESWQCIDHLCGNRACVNVDHMQAISRSLHMIEEQKRIRAKRLGWEIGG